MNGADFNPPRLLRNPHVQSVLASSGMRRLLSLRRGAEIESRAEEHILDCGEGIRLQGFHTAQRALPEARGLVVLLHGWEGSARSNYVLGTGARLLVSGTASVVGHESLHVGDPQRQLGETLVNVDTLLATMRERHFAQVPDEAVRPESLKLYLRNPADLAALEPQLARLRGAAPAPLLRLQGDVCRDDLLLEIEAVYAIDAPL